MKLADETGYQIVWAACGVVALAGVAVALSLRAKPRATAEPELALAVS
ncbi:hypothetical protein AB0F72_20470 [Actinoplanes sp. NPDC023936]